MAKKRAVRSAPASKPQVKRVGGLTDRQSRQLDLAWKWFDFHADQRTKMFNFMFVGLGIFANGVVTALDKHMFVPGALLSFGAIVLAYAFAKLDRRNQYLVHLGEEVLVHLEKRLFRKPKQIRNRSGDWIRHGILWRQQEELAKDPAGRGVAQDIRLGMHRFWLRAIAYLLALLFFLLGAYCVKKRYDNMPVQVPQQPTRAKDC